MNIHQIKSILIIANGEPPALKLIEELKAESDCIIAADGGSNLCRQYDIYPHFIVGDLDSIHPETLAAFTDSEIIKIVDQDQHDLLKAISFAKTLLPDIIRIAAGFGKRLDHSLANLLLLQQTLSDTTLEFYDDYGCLSVISGEHRLKRPVGTLVSCFSFLPVHGVSLTGFKYPLHKMDYSNGFNGLSNVITSESAKISIQKGFLLLYIANEDITT